MNLETRNYPDTAVPSSERIRQWSVARMEDSARTYGTSAEERLLGIFDVLYDVFNRADREAQSFVEQLDEVSRIGELDQVGAATLRDIRALVSVLAGEAELSNIWEFTLSWRVLMNGAIGKAVAGDLDAPLRAKEMARDLISRHRLPNAEAFPVSQQPQDGFDLNFDTFDDGLTEEGQSNAAVPATSSELASSAASTTDSVDFDVYVAEIETFYETHG